MIIKIDIDDNVKNIDAITLAHSLIKFNHIRNDAKSVTCGIEAKITQVSKAGNIFIHVSKIGEKNPANDIAAGKGGCDGLSHMEVR